MRGVRRCFRVHDIRAMVQRRVRSYTQASRDEI
jgi:hypothetical protein